MTNIDIKALFESLEIDEKGGGIMFVDRAKISNKNSRNVIPVNLKPDMLSSTDLDSGDDIFIVYAGDKIVITRKVAGIKIQPTLY
jgi:hypothetical protein